MSNNDESGAIKDAWFNNRPKVLEALRKVGLMLVNRGDTFEVMPTMPEPSLTFKEWWFKEETVEALERARTVEEECRIAWAGALASVSDQLAPATIKPTMSSTQPVAYFFRFHTDDSLEGKPNVRKWTLVAGEPDPKLYEVGEVRLLADMPDGQPAPEQKPAASKINAGVPLIWSESSNPTTEIPYNHCTAFTPFGRFLITWKGWKETNWPTVDETPWGEFFGSWSNLAEAKVACEAEFTRRVQMLIVPYQNPMLYRIATALADRKFRGATDSADLIAMAANVIAEDGTVIDHLRQKVAAHPPKGFEDLGLTLWDGKPHAATDTVWIQPGSVTK